MNFKQSLKDGIKPFIVWLCVMALFIGYWVYDGATLSEIMVAVSIIMFVFGVWVLGSWISSK